MGKDTRNPPGDSAGGLPDSGQPTDALVIGTEPDDRLQHVLMWIVAGGTEHQVAEAIRRHWPDVDAKPLILKAIDEFRKSGNLEKGVVRGWCFEAYRELYRKLVKAGDYAGALRAVKHIHGLTRSKG